MREAISAEGAVAVGPYSHAVGVGDLVICSGQTPLDPATGELATGGIGAQTKQCFANLFAVLEGAGLGAEDVVKANVYLTDMDTFAEMNAAYETVFAEPYPARTTIGVASLPLGASVEIELIAHRTPGNSTSSSPERVELGISPEQIQAKLNKMEYWFRGYHRDEVEAYFARLSALVGDIQQHGPAGAELPDDIHPDAMRTAGFTVVWRGYDSDEVRKYLNEVATELDRIL